VFFRVFGANTKTRVNRETCWEDSRVGETFYHLGKHLELNFLVTGRDSGLG
jgi:hypothetical protein